MNDNKQVSEEEMRKKLTPEQYRVLREKATEAPFSGKLLHNKANGMYRCAACGHILFNSDSKFDSTIGWPSFCDVAASDSVKLRTDTSFGMVRTEVSCANCGSHLGHMFDDDPTPTGKHYCINSLALDFDLKK